MSIDLTIKVKIGKNIVEEFECNGYESKVLLDLIKKTNIKTPKTTINKKKFKQLIIKIEDIIKNKNIKIEKSEHIEIYLAKKSRIYFTMAIFLATFAKYVYNCQKDYIFSIEIW